MPSLRAVAIVVLLLAGVSCTPRGQITIDPTAGSVGSVETILVATSRAPSPGFEVFSRERSQALGYARFEVSVPPDRAPGSVVFPREAPGDPRTDFLTVSATRINGRDAFLQALNRRLAAKPAGERQVVIFVHGFNNTFSEGLYRAVQMIHDFGTPGVGVQYAWPSAGDSRLFLYDRDSALFGRDGLASLLETVAASNAERILLVAHSMGAHLTIEALRQLALTGAPGVFDKLQPVMLMSPDIDVTLFRNDLRPLRAENVRWLVFTSSGDRALRLSALISGRDERLGALRDFQSLGDLDVTVIDMSNLQGVDSLGHQKAAESPEIISLINGLSQYGTAILRDEARNPTLVETTVQAVRDVTAVVVEPFDR